MEGLTYALMHQRERKKAPRILPEAAIEWSLKSCGEPMTPTEAKLILLTRYKGLVAVQAPPFASNVVSIVSAVKPPPSGAVGPSGMAFFETRLDREGWEAVKTLVEQHFARTNAPPLIQGN